MNVIQLSTWHRVAGGREVMAELTANLLERKGHKVRFIVRHAQGTDDGYRAKINAFLLGLYSRRDRRFIRKSVEANDIELVHVHGLYPYFSPWILTELHKANIPIVMTCHDYRLTCPTAFHLRSGRVCESCAPGKEYWCGLRNCRGNLLESFAYAFRGWFARKLKLIAGNVSLYITPSCFAREKLVAAGYPPESIVVVQNAIQPFHVQADVSIGEYVGFVGRVSPEKGIKTLLQAAEITKVPLFIAGDYSSMPELVSVLPKNVRLLGPMNQMQLKGFYANARFTVVPSICFETFGLTAGEAMSCGVPVIASRIGALPEVVDHGVTGYLVEPGNVEELANMINLLWKDPALCSQMGNAGRRKVLREYSEDMYYEKLMVAYRQVV